MQLLSSCGFFFVSRWLASGFEIFIAALVTACLASSAGYHVDDDLAIVFAAGSASAMLHA